jgi:hypothetical protein
MNNTIMISKNLGTVPLDVIINNIIPYTYHKQPSHLLIDIRTFTSDYSLVDSIYSTQYNNTILLNDLLRFCSINVSPSYGIQNIFEKVLRRNFIICNKSDEYMISLVIIHFHRNVNVNTERKIKFIWGLLTPNERTEFINMYVLE